MSQVLTRGSRLGSFEIVSPLGAGGMGEVWRATDQRLERDVALKMLPADLVAHPDRVSRFEREARLLASLSHPAIATLFGAERIDGRIVLVMELADGEDLARRLRRGPIPLDEALSIARQVAEALEAAHDKGIVHRDLKPANVKVAPDGRVKVLDFGLAKAWDEKGAGSDDSEAPTITDTGTSAGLVVGTAAYMSPEQARGRPVDRRTDVWAFGVLLFEMLTARRLFAGETRSDTLAAVLAREIDWSPLPATTPPSVRRLLSRCLSRDAKHRLHDIADARIELEDREEIAAEALAARRPSLLARVAPGVIAGAVVVLAAAPLLRNRAPAVPMAPIVRFALSPPVPGFFEAYPALSPDGRWLAYVLVSDKGPSSLWLHSFATGTARPVPGTEDAFEPFWSPDGRSVAFFAGGELRTLDVASGAVQSVCAAPDPRGGTWGSRGEILFGTTSVAGLRRVKLGDGSVDVVTELDSKRGMQSHRFPWFLPDGRHYVFTVLGNEDVSGLYFGDTAGSGYRKLGPDFSRAAYDSRGYLLFVRAGTLVAQRFDPQRGAFAGDPSPVAAQSIGANIGAESWFAAGSSAVAYRPSARQSTRLLWVDRAGSVVGEVTSPGAYMEPQLSPDGRKVVTEVQAPEKTRIELWVYETTGRDRGQRLPTDARVALFPLWSPDQRWIVYRARGPGMGEGAVARRAVSGAVRDEVLVPAGPARMPCAWSPDGRTVLLMQFSKTSGADLWTVDAEAPHALRPVLERPGNQGHASFSPDGRLLAYTSDEDRQPQVFVETFPPSGARWQITTGGGDYASWRADGREIYYVGVDRTLYAVPVRSLAPLTVGPAERLFRVEGARIYVTGPRGFYGPAPDGRRFLVARAASGEEGSRIEVVLNWGSNDPGESQATAAP
jgi:eukaryotic-like serine/threonine-protein kinase